MQTIDEIRHARFLELLAEAGSNAKMAERIGVSPSQVSQLKTRAAHSGTGQPRTIGDDTARKLEDAFSRPKGWMDSAAPAPYALPQTNLEHQGDTLQVPKMAVTGSMGVGSDQPDEEVVTGTLQIAAGWAAKHLPGARLPALRFITGYGQSMSPTFSSGDVLLVDTSVNSADVDGIYVLSNDQSLFIKRVTRRLDGTHEITSDNPHVRQIDRLNGDHPVTVLGRVVWLWNGKPA